MQIKQNLFWPISLGVAITFQALFFELSAGLNYLVFSALLLVILRFYIKPGFYSKPFIFILFLFIAVTAAVIFVHTTYSIFIYWIFTTLLISLAGYSRIKHLELSPLLAINGIESFMLSLKNKRLLKFTGKIKVFIKFIFLPGFTVIVLLWLYSNSNPLFLQSLSNIFEFVTKILEKVSFSRILFTLLGFFIAGIFISNLPGNDIVLLDNRLSNILVRVKDHKHSFGGLSKLLLRKRQVAIVAFIILNCMILWLNYLDIQNIWIGFSWDGGLLKSMVHDGTNMLIAAILISIGITLFYLHGNLVFLKNNRLFYGLIIFWLIQNILMAVSVSIRNTIYIEHFSLAYKRIFVYFFLLACVIGLLSIVYKIIYKRSVSFLLSVNSFSVLALLLISSCFNWDITIAKYNFENYKTSFVHYSFLVGLNDSALPYLIKSDSELNSIYVSQDLKFKLAGDKEFQRINYQGKIRNREKEFIKHWETKSILEWNYSEAMAFDKLSGGNDLD